MTRSVQTLLIDKIMYYSMVQPEKVALKFLKDDYQNAQTLTYAELGQRISSISNAILQTQLQKNNPLNQQPVLLIFDSSIEYILAFLAVLHSGNIAITAYPPRQERHITRLLKIIENSKASLVLTTQPIKDYCQANRFEFPQNSPMMSIEELQQNHPDFEGIKPDINKQQIAFLQYTSGSTSAPKGVMVTHENIVANLELITTCLGQDAIRKCVSWLPIFHDMGLIGSTLLPLFNGSTCVFMAPLTFLKTPFFWLQALSQEKGTYAAAPNFAYDLACDALDKKDLSNVELDFSEVCHLINGAEPVKPKTVRRFEQRLAPYGLAKNTIKIGYGMAETTLCISFEGSKNRFFKVDKKSFEQGIVAQNQEPSNQTELACCGTVTNAYQLKIVNPQTLQCCATNEVGEIWVQGKSVALGYFNDLKKTEEIFKAWTRDTQEGPFLRTGDLGFINPHGTLIVCGRIKDLLIINGRNIYPQDVEAACYESDPILIQDSAAAFELENEHAKECVIVAEVMPNRSEAEYTNALNQIKKAVFEHTDIVPYDILLIPPRQILKTSSGKIQRSACKKAYLKDEFEILARLKQTPNKEHHPDYMPVEEPGNLTEWLKQWISTKTQLPLKEIDTQRAFAEYGLNSIDLVAMIGELEKITQKTLDPWLAWEFPTISRLNQQLTEGSSSSATEDNSVFEPIAIIGMDCLLPGKEGQNINGLDELWKNLQENEDNIGPIPLERWDNRLYYDADRNKKGHMYCSEGGFLSDIKRFDAKFFNISPREAAYLDPQQRLLLMVVWHALEDAGITADEVKDSQTGIYIGLSTHDYDQLIQKNIPVEELNTYQATGTSFSTAAGRLAYFLGTHGPCMTLDTACSSSLVSVHQASRSLQDGDCRMAIAGGVNLILSPEGNIIFCKSNMLSPKSRCSTFDASADGYVRSEGCGIVILKKLNDALRDGNKIYAVIHGSAVNQDGASNGLTAPNLQAQIDVIQTALKRANLQPEEVTHVEAHGTGTELGDPIEWEGLRRTYGKERKSPLFITSLKTRIGHLEAAAGIAGLIKTVLAIKHGQIPAHLHLTQFNPKLRQQDNMQVPVELTPWRNESRFAGISSFGFSGTNAHVILGNAPTTPLSQESTHHSTSLWTLSAQNKERLHVYLKNYQEWGKKLEKDACFASLCHGLLTQRTHLPYRAFIVAENKTEWLEKLNNGDWYEGKIVDANAMAWLFTGQGCLMPNVAKQLHATLPHFATVIDYCCSLSSQWLPYDLRQILLNTPESVNINHTHYAQPALFVFEYALAKWLLKLGLRPQFLLGHSIGEYTAACIAGMLSVEEALMLVCKRALLFSKLKENGGMLAITASVSTVESLLQAIDNAVIALKNGPTQVVISGTLEAIAQCQRLCEEQTIPCKKIATSHAFHSPLIEPIAEEFEQIANQIHYQTPQIPVISNLTGRAIEEGQMNGRYWRRHMMETVEFHHGLQTILAKGVKISLEVGPKAVLVHQIQDDEVLTLSTVSDCYQPWPSLLKSLGHLHLKGVHINWHELNKQDTFAEMPLLKYPFEGKKYWLPQFETPQRGFSENTWKSSLYQPQWEPLTWQPPSHSVKETAILWINNKALKEGHQPPPLTFFKEKSSIRLIQTDSFDRSLCEEADIIVYFCDKEPTENLPQEIALMRELSQALIKNNPKKPFFFISETDSLNGQTLDALLKSIKQEHGEWAVWCLQIAPGADLAWCDFILNPHPSYWTLRYSAEGHYEQQKIIPLDASQLNDRYTITPQDVCLITGAYGDIGQILIEGLLALGLQYVIAVGRRETAPPWSTFIEEQKAKGVQLHYYCCDVSDSEAIKTLIATLPAEIPPVTVVIHAAGTTVDKPWLQTNESDIDTVLKAKALGAWSLHQATGHHPLKAFICISSLSALFGNQGQAPYAAANAFLNTLVNLRRNQGQPAQSLILGPIKNSGLFKKNEKSLTALLSEQGIAPLEKAELKLIFAKQLQCPTLILARFTKPLDEIGLLPQPQLPTFVSDTETSILQAENLLAMAQDILGAAKSDLSIHDNWFESGMDSIMASQLAHQINRKYKKKWVTAKDIFTYASAEQLAHKIREEQAHSSQTAVQAKAAPAATTFPLSLQQQEIWSFIKQDHHEKEAYHLPVAIQIEGVLSKDKLQEAISKVIAHHDILRCSFHTLLGQINQHVHDDCFLTLEFSEQYDEQEMISFFDKSFDLSHPPLLKTRLVKKAEDLHLWLLHFHHLISDGHTIRAFIHEVLKVYEGGVLAEEQPQYSHFVSWQWENVYHPLDNTLKSYWYETLRDVPLTVPLAVETNLPMQAQVVADNLSLEIIKPHLQQLKQNKLSLSNFLLANLFDTLLQAFQYDKLGLVVFFSGRENSPFASVFGDTSNDVIITSQSELDIFTHTHLVQNQILSKANKQHFRLALLNSLGLNKPAISFDFQKSIELNFNTDLN